MKLCCNPAVKINSSETFNCPPALTADWSFYLNVRLLPSITDVNTTSLNTRSDIPGCAVHLAVVGPRSRTQMLVRLTGGVDVLSLIITMSSSSAAPIFPWRLPEPLSQQFDTVDCSQSG